MEWERLKISLVVCEGPSGSFSRIVGFPLGGMALLGVGHFPFWECSQVGHHSFRDGHVTIKGPQHTTCVACGVRFTAPPNPGGNQLIRDKAMWFPAETGRNVERWLSSNPFPPGNMSGPSGKRNLPSRKPRIRRNSQRRGETGSSSPSRALVRVRLHVQMPTVHDRLEREP